MKSIAIGILLFVVTSGIASENVARESYLNKNYINAKNIYNDLSNNAPNNFAYQYNLASSYYRLDNMIFSKIHYLKALKIKPNDKDTLSNLKLINNKFIDKQFIFKNHWPHILGVNFNVLFSFMLILNAILFVAVFMFKNTPLIKRLKRPGIILSVVWGTFFVLCMFTKYNINQYGVVISEKTQVYSGPSKTQKSLFFAHQGAEYKIIKSSKSWTNVQFSNGLKGWIEGINIISI